MAIRNRPTRNLETGLKIWATSANEINVAVTDQLGRVIVNENMAIAEGENPRNIETRLLGYVT